jgi:hypothetical protein
MSLNPNHMVIADDILLREGWTKEQMQGGSATHLVPLYRDLEVIEFPVDQSTITRRYTDESIAFISKNAEENRPFFLYLAHTMPHIPLYVSPDFEDANPTCDELNATRGCGLYANVITEIDHNVGRILDTLKSLGIDSNTLVVYTADNGPWNLSGGRGGSAFPLSGFKFSNQEGGQREPTVMWWPGHIPAGLVQDEVGSTIDLLPTFASLIDIPIETSEQVLGKDWIVDGVDITDIILGQEGATRGIPFYYQGGAIRDGDFKFRDGKLYNLSEDITESTEIDDAAKKAELQNELQRFWGSIEIRGAGNENTELPVAGCTNPDASNFNPNARRDDGSCILFVRGCMDPTANNYDVFATQDDGTCSYITPIFVKEDLKTNFIKIQTRSRNIKITLARPAGMEVKSLTGQSLLNFGGKISRTHTISRNVLKPGVYFLHVEIVGASLVEKFMVY